MGVTKFFDDRIGIVIPIKGGTGVRIWNKIELNKAVVFRFAKLAPGGQVVPDTDGDLISIHTPAWGATEIVTYTIRVTNTFQFTPPRGGRLFARDPDAMLDIFQFTPPRGGRRPNPALFQRQILFQFTPPRGGRLGVLDQELDARHISIHAPAWGATTGK